MNEKINSLAVLFAERESIDRQIEELLGRENEPSASKEPKLSRVVPKQSKERKGKKFTEEQVQEMYDRVDAGESKASIAKDFGVSDPVIHYYLKKRAPGAAKGLREVPLKAIHEYRCLGCGRTFKTILLPGEAYCPKPSCNKSTPIEEVL